MSFPAEMDTQKKNKEVKRRCRLTASPSIGSKLKMQMLKITRFYHNSPLYNLHKYRYIAEDGFVQLVLSAMK
ncbi:MAG: hypothetical protein CV087_11360 [Candidatus Brocadia sp. WS118]|nr:MAG: hypothetical protein CV087_11360 [Candidatus Brocadia sp. WS118]